MSDIFTRDSDGKKFTEAMDCTGAWILKPVPAPPQTEAEILAEMDREIDGAYPIRSDAQRAIRVARAIVAACGKIGEGK